MAHLPLIHIGMLPTDGVVGDRLRHGRSVVGRVWSRLRPFLHARLARKCGLGREPNADSRHRSRVAATFRSPHLRTLSSSRDGNWAEVGISADGDGVGCKGEAGGAARASDGGAG